MEELYLEIFEENINFEYKKVEEKFKEKRGIILLTPENIWIESINETIKENYENRNLSSRDIVC